MAGRQAGRHASVRGHALPAVCLWRHLFRYVTCCPGRMPPNAPEAAHYKLQLVALQREVDKGKGNSMLYSAYLQVSMVTGFMRLWA